MPQTIMVLLVVTLFVYGNPVGACESQKPSRSPSVQRQIEGQSWSVLGATQSASSRAGTRSGTASGARSSNYRAGHLSSRAGRNEAQSKGAYNGSWSVVRSRNEKWPALHAPGRASGQTTDGCHSSGIMTTHSVPAGCAYERVGVKKRA